jgi:hypothetical protein
MWDFSKSPSIGRGMLKTASQLDIAGNLGTKKGRQAPLS